jgi:hypothetical protein
MVKKRGYRPSHIEDRLTTLQDSLDFCFCYVRQVKQATVEPTEVQTIEYTIQPV